MSTLNLSKFEGKNFFKVTVKYENYSDKIYYIAAYSVDDAKNIVSRFKPVSTIAGSKIDSVIEIFREEFEREREKVEKRKNQLKSFDIAVSVLKNEGTSFTIEHFYTRSESKQKAAEYIKERLKANNIQGSFDANKDVKEISYEEYREKRSNAGIKFYKVTAKCGHVGDGMFFPVDFYLIAKSKNEAVEKVKKYPRVKKTNPSEAIISIEEITKDEYSEGKKEMENNPFLHHNILDEKGQTELYDLIEQNKKVLPRIKRLFDKAKRREAKGIDITEEQLKNKQYKMKRSAYKDDAGLHINPKLKYAKGLINLED